jgi:PAS domain-containing protein
MSREQIEHLLTRLINRLISAMATAPVDDQAAVEVAVELLTHGLTEPRGMGRSIEVLAEGLPRLAELQEVDQARTAVLRMLASLASGYAEALQQRTSDEQKQATQALVQAKQVAELELRICETRFREIFSTSAVGLAISTFDGTVVTANRAFAEIVGLMPVDRRGAARSLTG